jgi:hypothetical protein
MDRDEMSKLYKRPSIDGSYQVSVHLAKGFQRRRLTCEKLTDDRRQVMAKAHIVFGKVSYSKMTTTAGHSFYIGPIGSFYNQVNDTGS